MGAHHGVNCQEERNVVLCGQARLNDCFNAAFRALQHPRCRACLPVISFTVMDVLSVWTYFSFETTVREGSEAIITLCYATWVS